MTTRDDGGPADFLDDHMILGMCSLIAGNFGKGFPLNEQGQQIPWTDWFRNRIADATLAQRKESG